MYEALGCFIRDRVLSFYYEIGGNDVDERACLLGLEVRLFDGDGEVSTNLVGEMHTTGSAAMIRMFKRWTKKTNGSPWPIL
jgi:hypothetical protein